MADMSGVQFDPNVEESAGGGFTVITPGWYEGVIIKDKIQKTKSGNGLLWKFKTQLTAGQFAGEQVEGQITISNSQYPKNQAIGQGQIKALCNIHEIEYPPKDTAPMLGRPMGFKIINEEFVSNKTGNPLKSNKISGFCHVDKLAEKGPVIPAEPSTTTTTATDAGGW